MLALLSAKAAVDLREAHGRSALLLATAGVGLDCRWRSIYVSGLGDSSASTINARPRRCRQRSMPFPSQLRFTRSADPHTQRHTARLQEAGGITVVRALLERGADPGAADAFGRTALHWAGAHASLELASLLMERKASLQAATSSGDTPLHWACGGSQRSGASSVVVGGRQSVAAALLAGGADATAQNALGKAPADVLPAEGLNELRALLLVETAAVAPVQPKDGGFVRGMGGFVVKKSAKSARPASRKGMGKKLKIKLKPR